MKTLIFDTNHKLTYVPDKLVLIQSHPPFKHFPGPLELLTEGIDVFLVR